MPSFIDRPLTWLFIVATLCADLALVAARFSDHWSVTAFIVGQAFVAGGWLALGGTHRLARAGVGLAVWMGLTWIVIYCLVQPARIMDGEPWRDVGPSMAILLGGAAVATLLWRGLLPLGLPGRRPAARKFQFPIIELFGWAIVVAVASTALRLLELSRFTTDVSDVVALTVWALIAALLMALFLERSRARGLASAVIAALAVGAMYLILPSFVPNFDRETKSLVAGAYAYVILWIVVQRFDDAVAIEVRARDRAEEAATPETSGATECHPSTISEAPPP